MNHAARAAAAEKRRNKPKPEINPWDVEVWYPTSADLPLLHVPKEVQPKLRTRLRPWLKNLTHADSLQPAYCTPSRVGIRSGCCWEVAQALVTTAKDPGVTLIEGVWMRDGEHEPVPHTWCVVDGFRVDLIGEFYCWREDTEWLYEPLAEYTFEDVRKLFGDGPNDDGIYPEGFAISSHLWEQRGGWESLPKHLTMDLPNSPLPNGQYGTPEERDAYHRQVEERSKYELNIVFKPAVERLLAKLKQTAVGA
jgi:hypothetical protein